MSSALVAQLKADSFLDRLTMASPSFVDPARMVAIALSMVNENPQLKQAAETNPHSFFAAFLTAAQLGLEPNTPRGECWLIPRKIHGKPTCVFQLGYRGTVAMLWRTGQIRTIKCHLLYEGCTFDERLDGPPLWKKAEYSQRGEVVGVFALIVTNNGGFLCEHMHIDEVNEVRDRFSQAFNKSSSPWKTDWPAMAKKTALIRCAKLAPLSAELRDGLAIDERGATDSPVMVTPGMELDAHVLAAAAQKQLAEASEQAASYVGEDGQAHGAAEAGGSPAPENDPTGRGTPKEQVMAYIEKQGVPKDIADLAIEKALRGNKTAAGWKSIADDLDTFGAMCSFIADERQATEPRHDLLS